MIKIGFDTWLWTRGVFVEKDIWCIKEAARLGGKVIDFAIANISEFPVEKVKEALKETSLEPITSTTLMLHNNPISPDEDSRNRALKDMKKTIDITREIGGKITGGVNYTASGYLTKKIRTEQELEWSVNHMRKVADYAHETSDIVIAVEPVKRFESHMLNTAEQALEYIDMVGSSNMGIHLDTFHMNIEEASFRRAVELCGEKLVYMHLIENNRSAPGMGHIPWIELFTALKDIGYNGPATIETFDPEDLEATYPMTFLYRKFGENSAEICVKGLRHLEAVNTMVFG